MTKWMFIRQNKFILLFLLIGMNAHALNIQKNESYWLWAGITAKDAPKMKDYYIYQGVISEIDSKVNIQHIGLYPHPIPCSPCFLVYRFRAGLPDVKGVVNVFLADVKKWQKHHVPMRGLQIDYDSPTKKLSSYAVYLAKLRRALPADYDLNITGLVNWVVEGDRDALTSISKQTTYIAYQLYNGKHSLNDILFYRAALKKYPHPFRVGMLQNIPLPYSKELEKNPNFHGIIYFIQKR